MRRRLNDMNTSPNRRGVLRARRGDAIVRGCLFLLLATFGKAAARAETFNGVEFPSGAASFSDAVLRYDPFFGEGPAPNWRDPMRSAGPPSNPVDAFGSYQALGNGGLIEMLFGDNLLTNSGTSSADLYVGEVSGTPEDFYLELRPTAETIARLDPSGDSDGDGYFEIGRFVTGPRLGSQSFVLLLDIDQFFLGNSPNSLAFDAARFIDDATRGSTTGQTVGFDLESVGAIASIASNVVRQAGDTDEDGDVDLNDLNAVRNHFGTVNRDLSPAPGDAYPYDSDVDLNDLNAVRNNFGAGAANLVPEPSTLALLALGAAGFVVRRRIVRR